MSKRKIESKKNDLSEKPKVIHKNYFLIKFSKRKSHTNKYWYYYKLTIKKLLLWDRFKRSPTSSWNCRPNYTNRGIVRHLLWCSGKCDSLWLINRRWRNSIKLLHWCPRWKCSWWRTKTAFSWNFTDDNNKWMILIRKIRFLMSLLSKICRFWGVIKKFDFNFSKECRIKIFIATSKLKYLLLFHCFFPFYYSYCKLLWKVSASFIWKEISFTIIIR